MVIVNMNETNIAKVDLNLLKALNALLKERHVGRAAESVFVSQSAMSHSLAKLRVLFADPLFIRHSKGLTPTPFAEKLQLNVPKLMENIQQLFQPEQLNLTTIKQTFVIQTHDFVVANYLGKALNNIRTQAPNLLFDIQLLDKQSNQRLENGQVDLLIGAGLTAKDSFYQQHLIDEPIMCLYEKEHSVISNWNGKSIFSYAHLKMTLLEGLNDPISKYAQTQQLTRKIGLQVESLNLQLSLLVGSELLAFLPQSMCEQGKQQYGLCYQALPFPLPTINIRSVWDQRLHNDALHQWVRQQIKRSFRA